MQVALIGLIGLSIHVSHVSAQQRSGDWTEPVTFGRYWFPDIAADPYGRVHLVWTDYDLESGYDLVMYTSSENGEGWIEPRDIAAVPEVSRQVEATRPALLVGQDGMLYMTYRGIDIYYSKASLAEAQSAASWQSPMQIGTGYFSRIGQDSTGRLHIITTENVVSSECAICFRVFYSRSDDGITWDSPVDLSLAQTGSAKPWLLVDRNDGLHVVWEAGYGGTLGRVQDPASIMYTRSVDGGATWSIPKPFGPAPPVGEGVRESLRGITIAQGPQDQLVVVWYSTATHSVYYQISEDYGGMWSSPRLLPNVWAHPNALDTYSVATDSAGHVHMVMIGGLSKEQADLAVLHLEWDGVQWSWPSVIASYTGDQPEWPRVAVGEGNQLHVAWFVRDEANIFNSDNGNYGVWYAHSRSAAPRQERLELPTPPPTPISTMLSQPQYDDGAETASQVVSSALTMVAVPTQVASIASLKTEMDELALLAKSTLATLCLIWVVLIIHRRRQH